MKMCFVKCFSIFILFCCNTFSGQKNKTIAFGEFLGGFSRTSEHSDWLYGVELNFQAKKLLFSARYVENYYQFIKISAVPIEVIWLPIPVIEDPKYLKDYSVFLGYRKTEENFSFSFSGGISYNNYTQNFHDGSGKFYSYTENFWGIPLEANIKWYKENKSPYRIYGIIPVGKPTAIGNSIGFKLLGNISKKSYIGLALVWGIGIHKEY